MSRRHHQEPLLPRAPRHPLRRQGNQRAELGSRKERGPWRRRSSLTILEVGLFLLDLLDAIRIGSRGKQISS
jgi:hypothetical protein